jgi:hypothetical integral membrane protein (TIGR02206 family)
MLTDTEGKNFLIRVSSVFICGQLPNSGECPKLRRNQPSRGSLRHGNNARVQTAALLFTVFAPLLLWVFCRRCPADVLVRRTLAILLLAFEVGALIEKSQVNARWTEALPMHLCDWVLCAVAVALWSKARLCFELGYFWGLAGTVQALITPAIDSGSAAWRLFVFFFSHALIVVGVFHLILVERLRPVPASLWRVFLCSEIYLVTALAVNALAGTNYGFLAHKPEQASMLDLFSNAHWLYVLEINATALIFFPMLYLPWLVWDSTGGKRAPIPLA